MILDLLWYISNCEWRSIYDGDPFIMYSIWNIWNSNVSFPIMMDLLYNGDPYIVYLVCYATQRNIPIASNYIPPLQHLPKRRRSLDFAAPLFAGKYAL